MVRAPRKSFRFTRMALPAAEWKKRENSSSAASRRELKHADFSCGSFCSEQINTEYESNKSRKNSVVSGKEAYTESIFACLTSAWDRGPPRRAYQQEDKKHVRTILHAWRYLVLTHKEFKDVFACLEFIPRLSCNRNRNFHFSSLFSLLLSLVGFSNPIKNPTIRVWADYSWSELLPCPGRMILLWTVCSQWRLTIRWNKVCYHSFPAFT